MGLRLPANLVPRDGFHRARIDLAEGLGNLPRVRLIHPVAANELFVDLPEMRFELTGRHAVHAPFDHAVGA